MDGGWPNGGQLPQSDFSGTGPVSEDGLLFGFDFLPDMSTGATDGPLQNHQQWPQQAYQAQHPAPHQQPQPQPQQQQQHHFAHPDPSLTLDAFLQSNGGWRPPEPCSYCRRMRLQCFMLQTTEANPNPVTSCSSCVALFRQCSLAERAKRHHADYETGAPVIGQLHGVSEEGYVDPPFQQPHQPYQPGQQQQSYPTPVEGRDLGRAPSQESLPGLQGQTGGSTIGSLPGSAPGKRISARMVKRTRALRNWFAKHQEHPYPTDDEKIALAEESGLSRVQVTNWFTNARRRQRQSVRATAKQDFFVAGSPMPQRSPNDFSPMERWRNSPPEDEAIDPGALKDALNDLKEEPGSSAGMGRHARGRSSHLDFSSGSASNASSYNPRQANWLEAHSSNSAGSSVYSHQAQAADTFGLVSPNDPNEGYSSGDSGQNSAPRRRSTSGAPSTSANPPAGPSSNLPVLQCTFCRRTFKKKSDWVRHERTIHVPDLDSWICSLSLLDETQQSQLVWRLGHNEPECVFCGEKAPSPEHLRSHEFEACAERPVQERTFARKDHLWQHLKKFHGCKRWEGWSLDLNRLQISNDGVSSRCGFCGLVMTSWKARAQHVAAHFRTGLTMAQWTGDSGVLSQ